MKRALLGLIGLMAIAGSLGADGDGCAPAPTQGEPCGPGDACAIGLTCLHYYGIAGPSGPEFTSCEIPCGHGETCPDDQVCTTIMDGPGAVCRPVQVQDCDAAASESCGPDQVCVAASVEQPGTCGAFAHGQSVGAGYACGGSIGVSCAEGLFCKGLPQGVLGGAGTCTFMTCNDWQEEYRARIGAISHCSSGDECVDVHGTSCGCTRNVVVNRNEDVQGFQSFVQQMNDAGCGLVSTCDCPPADGYACNNGVCGWNYR